MFSKTYCPHCNRAKETLKRVGADVKYVELDHLPDGPSVQAAVRTLYGHGTVPAIFFNSALIGGNDDLTALDKSGELPKKLAAAIAASKSS